MNSGLSGDFIFLVKSPLTNVLLVAYGIGFPGKLVLVRQSRIKGGNELLGGLS